MKKEFVCFYRVCVYDQGHEFDTKFEAKSFAEECEREGMEVDLYEVEREESGFEGIDGGYDFVSGEEIETLITKPVEESVGTVKNIKRISSKSKEGISLVTAEFLWNTNMDRAAMNVREKIDLIKEKLPPEADEPVIMKYNPFELPIMIESITGSNNLTPSGLLYTTRHIIKDRLEKVDGVASIGISGGQERQILVEID